jgi:hypothetical protein
LHQVGKLFHTSGLLFIQDEPLHPLSEQVIMNTEDIPVKKVKNFARLHGVISQKKNNVHSQKNCHRVATQLQ